MVQTLKLKSKYISSMTSSQQISAKNPEIKKKTLPKNFVDSLVNTHNIGGIKLILTEGIISNFCRYPVRYG